MKRALIDLSSVIWTCLLAGKDKEFGKEYPNEDGSKMVWVNSAGYGYENALNHLETVMEELSLVPRQMIFVIEGKDAKAERQFILPSYKSKRDKVPRQYEVFNEVKAMLLKSFLDLGAQAVSQDGGVEADDVLGYLALNLKGERWIVSADKDLAQVVGGDVHHYRMGTRDANPFGPFDHKLIPVYIALVGDSTDGIPGARGFGPKAFLDLLTVFGDAGLVEMERLIKERKLETLEEDVGELKALQKVIDDRDAVYASYELGRLRLEKVNTMRRPLQWKVGMVKPRAQIEDERLRKYGGEVRLISAENYADALAFFKKHAAYSPEISLDIETSTPPESDEWLEQLGKSEERTPVDVFGSELTGMGLTFGRNMNLTFYLTVDHVPEKGVSNLTKDQVRKMLEQIPKSKQIVAHNCAFELPVLRMEIGDEWADDPDWHGFIPNLIDSRIMSSYVDENRSAGLKNLSSGILGYEQETYQEVTTKDMPRAHYKGTGKIVAEWQNPGDDLDAARDEDYEGIPMCRVQYKMNELTARHVLSYGADDTICTAALSNHFRTIMEIEQTWDVFMEVEQLPAYLTAKAFIDGVDFSLETMREMEKDDDVAYDAAWKTLREYLIKIGFDGVNPPVFEEINAASIKEACEIVVGQKLTTQIRTPAKLAKLIRQQWETDDFADKAALLATVIEDNHLGNFNALVQRHFSGEPQIDLASPKQMTRLLYDHMGLPVNIVNDVTALEKKSKPELAAAMRKFKQKKSGSKDVRLSDEDLALIRKKAKADDTAIEYALAFDAELISEEAREALLAIGTMKRVMTRRSLFYKTYWNIPHWKDGKIHANVNQCGTVTRRYSASNPNLQQVPKKGEGVKFRAGFQPHDRDAVVCSIDFSGQELRLAAERSQDKNMLACYIGDRLKDIHSITAAGAMKLKWGVAAVKEYFQSYGDDIAAGEDAEYELFVRLRKLGKANPVGKKAEDLRKDSKNVNFAAQFGGQAAKLSETLIMKLEDAQLFLDARSAMFPDVDKAAERAEAFCKRHGYAVTMMGARRHLREAMLSDDAWAVSRAARQAWNMEIQGSAAEMTKLAMARLWKSDFLWKYRTRFIAPIHDELVTSIHKDDVLEAVRIKHECMTQPYSTMKVPVMGSISIGRNFAEQIECGDWYIRENLDQAVNDIFTKEAA